MAGPELFVITLFDCIYAKSFVIVTNIMTSIIAVLLVNRLLDFKYFLIA